MISHRLWKNIKVRLPSICKKRMYALYNTARNEYSWVYQFRITLVNKSYSYVSNVTYMIKIGKHFAKTRQTWRISCGYQHILHMTSSWDQQLESNRSELPLTASGVARLCTRLRRTYVRGKWLDMPLSTVDNIFTSYLWIINDKIR
jgi:hypothetical protein